MKLLIIFFIFGAKSAWSADCKQLNKINIPAEFIHAYIEPQKKDFLFPVSGDFCLRKNMRIDFYSGKSKYGSVQIKDFNRRPFSDAYFESSEARPYEKRFYKNMYKNGVRPIKFIKTWMYLLDQKYVYSDYKPFYMVRAQVITKNRNFERKNPYSDPDTHWAAKNISYKELLKIVQNKKGKFVRLTKPYFSNTKPEQVFFKYPLLLPELKVNFFRSFVKFDFFDFFTLPLGEVDLKTPIVVESRPQNGMEGYNAITELFFRGYRNIYWFNDSSEKWSARKNQAVDFGEGFKDFFNVNNFFNYLNDPKAKVYDYSKPSYYSIVRIKKAQSITMLEGVYESNLAHVILSTSKPEDKILLIGWGKFKNLKRLKKVYGTLTSKGYKNIKIYKENTGYLLDRLLRDYPPEKVRPYFYEGYDTYRFLKRFKLR